MSDDTLSMEATETPAVEQVETVEPKVTELPEEVEQEKKDAEAPIPKGVQKRIDRAIRRQYEAEAEAKYLREQIARAQAQPVQQQAQATITEDAPRLENFQTYEDFLRAQARFEAKQEINQTLAAQAQREAMERAQAAQRQTAESWQQKVTKATAELPDFADVVGSSSAPMPEHVKQMVLNSDQGPKLAYYLATHPDEAEQIATQHPLAAIRALVRIEDKLDAAKAVKKTTDAPEPISTVGAKAKSTKSPSEMTDKEFAEWRKKQIAARR